MDTALPAYQGIAVLLLIGFIMVSAEVFVPGMILGMIGGLCLIAGVGWSYAAYGLGTGTMVLTGVGLFGSLAFIAYMKTFPRTFLGRQFINTSAMPGVVENLPSELLGKTGEALTALRPSGTARIEGRRTDVLAEGSFIDPHETVTVIRIEKNYLVVRKTVS